MKEMNTDIGRGQIRWKAVKKGIKIAYLEFSKTLWQLSENKLVDKWIVVGTGRSLAPPPSPLASVSSSIV
jgi:hypothetical protein